MEKERDFFIIENLTQKEIDESFEKLKKNIIKIFSDFKKSKNENFKVTDLNYSTKKFIRINIDGIFILEGYYIKEYSFDTKKNFHTNNIELIDTTFHNPVTGINTVFDLVIKDIREFTKNSNLVYSDAPDINIIDDFIKFMDNYFHILINTYGVLEFNCLYIKKYGRLVQIIGENVSEMTDDYKLTSSMNFTEYKNKKQTYSMEEIMKIRFLERISYEDLEKQYKESLIEKM